MGVLENSAIDKLLHYIYIKITKAEMSFQKVLFNKVFN